jgi:hypothetical protein
VSESSAPLHCRQQAAADSIEAVRQGKQSLALAPANEALRNMVHTVVAMLQSPCAAQGCGGWNLISMYPVLQGCWHATNRATALLSLASITVSHYCRPHYRMPLLAALVTCGPVDAVQMTNGQAPLSSIVPPSMKVAQERVRQQLR